MTNPNGPAPIMLPGMPVQTREVRDMQVRTNALALAAQVHAGRGSAAAELLADARALAAWITSGD